MDTIFILRLIIAATFVITASGFPIAILLLRRFTKLYTRKHEELKLEVQTLRAEIQVLASRMTTMEQVDGQI